MAVLNTLKYLNLIKELCKLQDSGWITSVVLIANFNLQWNAPQLFDGVLFGVGPTFTRCRTTCRWQHNLTITSLQPDDLIKLIANLPVDLSGFTAIRQ